MADRRASLMDPKLENLMSRVDSKFTLVTLASRRAREINAYFGQLGDGLGTIVPPQVTSVSRKPLSITLEEIEADKIRFRRPAQFEGDPDAVGEAPAAEGEVEAPVAEG